MMDYFEIFLPLAVRLLPSRGVIKLASLGGLGLYAEL